MKYLQKTFQSTPATDAYRKGYEGIRWGTPKKKAKPAGATKRGKPK